jgi:hypothetical protein
MCRYGPSKRRAETPVTGGSTCLRGPASAGPETQQRLAIEPLEPATGRNDTGSPLRAETPVT